MDVDECGGDSGTYAEVCLNERLSFGAGSVMGWAEITAQARTFIANGFLTGPASLALPGSSSNIRKIKWWC